MTSCEPGEAKVLVAAAQGGNAKAMQEREHNECCGPSDYHGVCWGPQSSHGQAVLETAKTGAQMGGHTLGWLTHKRRQQVGLDGTSVQAAEQAGQDVRQGSLCPPLAFSPSLTISLSHSPGAPCSAVLRWQEGSGRRAAQRVAGTSQSPAGFAAPVICLSV
jgi:hypothetical protein